MKWVKRILLACAMFVGSVLQAQNCDYYYKYTGPPGYLDSNIVEVNAMQQWVFDYFTVNVPDEIIVLVGADTVSLYGGASCGLIYSNCFSGYVERTYSLNGSISTTMSMSTPSDYSFYSSPKSSFRVRIFIPDGICQLRYFLRGNSTDNTDLELCIKKIPYPEEYIIKYEESCIQRPPRYEYNGCGQVTQILTIQKEPNVEILLEAPSCLRADDGQIYVIGEYSEIEGDLEDLHEGEYEFTVIFEDTCRKEFNVTLTAELCNNDVYIPNAFSPNYDGINDIFTYYTKYPIKADFFKIFDRWGGLVMEKYDVASSIEGWNGYNYGVGVYVYLIKIRDKLYAGDITLVR